MLRAALFTSLIILASCTSTPDASNQTAINTANEKVARTVLFNGFQLTPYPSSEFKPGYVFYIDRNGTAHKVSSGKNIVDEKCLPSMTPKIETASSGNLGFGLNWLFKKYNANVSAAFSNGVTISAEPQLGCILSFSDSFDNVVGQAEYIRGLRQEIAEAASIDPIFNTNNLFLVSEAIKTASFKVSVKNYKVIDGQLGVDLVPSIAFSTTAEDNERASREFFFENQTPELFVLMKILQVNLGSGADGETSVSFKNVNLPK